MSRYWNAIPSLLYRFALLLPVLIFFPGSLFAHTLAEVVEAPATFDQQDVTVLGQADDMVTRYGETPYTTFVLFDADDHALPVFMWGIPTCRMDDICRITGTFTLEKTIGPHHLLRGVEAEKVEKISEAEYKTAGPLFRKRKSFREGFVGRHLQGFTAFPQ